MVMIQFAPSIYASKSCETVDQTVVHSRYSGIQYSVVKLMIKCYSDFTYSYCVVGINYYTSTLHLLSGQNVVGLSPLYGGFEVHPTCMSVVSLFMSINLNFKTPKGFGK